jgi:predicted nucleic acid-binding protein
VAVKGTLGILEEAANRNLVDLAEALSKLQATSIFLPENIVQDALKRYSERHHNRNLPKR